MIGPFEVILLVAFCRIEAGVPVVQPTVNSMVTFWCCVHKYIRSH